MAAFDYQAVDSRGKTKKGVIEGDTPRQARALLREQGLMPTEITPTLNNKKTKSGKPAKGKVKGKVSASELALITRQLATLVESGLPLEESLIAVAEQGEKNNIKSMIMGVRTKVTEGYGLAESMAEYPKVFNRLYRAMIAAGERSGRLPAVLNRVADAADEDLEVAVKRVSVMLEPLAIVVLGSVIGIVAIALLLPVFKMSTIAGG